MSITPQEIERLQKEIEPITVGFDLIDDHVIVTDPEGTVVYANYAAQKNTGFSREEIIGKNPGKIWGGHMPKEFYEKMWRTIKTEKRPFVGEVKNKRKDGTDYWQELRVFPVFGEYGDIKIFIGIEPNITGRKIAEAEQAAKYKVIDNLNKYMTGRELKMVDLKKQIESLKKQLFEKNK